MSEIVYSSGALQYLDDLILLLLRKEYFSFKDTAINYVRDIKDFIQKNIAIVPSKKAPARFNKISTNVKYISYKRNKHTTWFIFFTQKDNRYFIEHITNNHVSAQYIGG